MASSPTVFCVAVLYAERGLTVYFLGNCSSAHFSKVPSAIGNPDCPAFRPLLSLDIDQDIFELNWYIGLPDLILVKICSLGILMGC